MIRAVRAIINRYYVLDAFVVHRIVDAVCAQFFTAPHSPRRHKINWRMKSVSLDSSEPADYGQSKCNVIGSVASIEPHSSHSSSSRLQCTHASHLKQFSFIRVYEFHAYQPSRTYRALLPNSILIAAPSSPVHNRRLLTARPIRMSSVELPDDTEKSPSSASNSPIPSPMVYLLITYI